MTPAEITNVTTRTASLNVRQAITNALDYAATSGVSLYFPSGTYLTGIAGSGQSIGIPAGVKIYSTDGATIKSPGYPIFDANERTTIEGFTFDGSAGGVLIGIQIIGDNVTIRNNKFINGSQLICIYTADYLTVEDNYFTECGYQIIQKAGYASNNCKVINNTALDCVSDFVELNSGLPCTNWLVSGNTVKNVNTVAGALATESRFFGSTSTKNVVITNNLVENTAGDSMLHFEGSSADITISNNIFVDPHGAHGKLIFCAPGATVDSLIFTNNIVKLTSGYTLYPTESELLCYFAGNDSSNPVFSNNLINNESSVNINFGYLSDTEDAVISGNRFVGLATAILTGIGRAPSGTITPKTISIHHNIFQSCQVAVDIGSPISENRHYRVLIDRNVFKDCAEVFVTAYPDTALPASLQYNTVRGVSNIDEALVIKRRIWNPVVSNNYIATTSGATTTASLTASYTNIGVAELLISSAGYTSAEYFIHSGGYSNNSAWVHIRIVQASPIVWALTTVASGSSGAGAPFTITQVSGSIYFSSATAATIKVNRVGHDRETVHVAIG